MIIRYQKTDKIGDHSTTSVLTVKDADPSSLDKVLKYFEPQESQQQIAIHNAQTEPKPSQDEPEFNQDFSINKGSVTETFAKESAPAVLKHPEGNVLKKAEVVQGPRKTVPLTGSTKGAYSIGDLLGKIVEEPKENRNIRHTDDGLRLYRTKWTCPGCGQVADRFNADTNDYVKCRDCGTKAELQPSTERFLEEDKDGYYFHADKPLEV